MILGCEVGCDTVVGCPVMFTVHTLVISRPPSTPTSCSSISSLSSYTSNFYSLWFDCSSTGSSIGINIWQYWNMKIIIIFVKKVNLEKKWIRIAPFCETLYDIWECPIILSLPAQNLWWVRLVIFFHLPLHLSTKCHSVQWGLECHLLSKHWSVSLSNFNLILLW